MNKIWNCFPRPQSRRKCHKVFFFKDTTEYREQVFNQFHVEQNHGAFMRFNYSTIRPPRLSSKASVYLKSTSSPPKNMRL